MFTHNNNELYKEIADYINNKNYNSRDTRDFSRHSIKFELYHEILVTNYIDLLYQKDVLNMQSYILSENSLENIIAQFNDAINNVPTLKYEDKLATPIDIKEDIGNVKYVNLVLRFSTTGDSIWLFCNPGYIDLILYKANMIKSYVDVQSTIKYNEHTKEDDIQSEIDKYLNLFEKYNQKIRNQITAVLPNYMHKLKQQYEHTKEDIDISNTLNGKK